MKIDLSHTLHWPPQPTTIAGVAIIGAGLFVAPKLLWPALITGLVVILGDDGTRPKADEPKDRQLCPPVHRRWTTQFARVRDSTVRKTPKGARQGKLSTVRSFPPGRGSRLGRDDPNANQLEASA